MNIQTIRNWQFNLMETNIRSYGFLFGETDPASLTQYRDGGNGWTPLEVLGHLRDFERIFQQRTQVTLTEEGGQLPFPNPDELAISNRYNEQDWRAVLADWQATRITYLAQLRSLSESDWQRSGLHPVRGPLSLTDQLFLSSQHDSVHMEQVLRTLSEKRSQ